ncbi:hypothetical protein SUGI_0208720 [Cryptomeria japonica]|nr:hypothetical protein SUGI_0208720 [Cryptomeria japonica]
MIRPSLRCAVEGATRGGAAWGDQDRLALAAGRVWHGLSCYRYGSDFIDAGRFASIYGAGESIRGGLNWWNLNHAIMGHIVNHGPRGVYWSFFESYGFKCLRERESTTDFLHEVTSKEDQEH